MKRRLFLAAAAAFAAGCTLAPKATQPTLYDFGIEPPPAPGARLRSRVALAHVSADPWLQSQAIVYRLAYENAKQLHPYALSRWAAPPADLITQRLRMALGVAAGNGFSMAADGLVSDHLLRVHLEAFEQVVDTPATSRGVVRMTARLSGADRRLRGQRPFRAERPCPSVDAAGGVQALTAAADALIAEIVAWVAAQSADKS